MNKQHPIFYRMMLAGNPTWDFSWFKFVHCTTPQTQNRKALNFSRLYYIVTVSKNVNYS